MLDKMASFFKSEITFSHMSSLLDTVQQVLSHFEADYMQDGNAYAAALETLVQMIQTQAKPAQVSPIVTPPAQS
jgi:hypothetical protein